ncbi:MULTISPECIES: OsmC family protein [Actinoplanes]|uniref:OsmC family protein n=1 Tax=Actinoplanes TaxID=1865 RepID=UPI0005F2C2BF|nr:MULTISPECIES: OsmC family protein [Actinoplanes]GLY05458.1 peroxiredoxin [Actinoplanes sp. NBRC 101535]
MTIRTSSAVWNGDLKSGTGDIALGSGALNSAYTFASRFEDGAGTNPEELIAAAHAACFSMFLANVLAGAGHTADSVRTVAAVTLGDGPAITGIALTTEARVPGLAAEAFATHVETAKAGCPISAALAAVPITVTAALI